MIVSKQKDEVYSNKPLNMLLLVYVVLRPVFIACHPKMMVNCMAMPAKSCLLNKQSRSRGKVNLALGIVQCWTKQFILLFSSLRFYCFICSVLHVWFGFCCCRFLHVLTTCVSPVIRTEMLYGFHKTNPSQLPGLCGCSSCNQVLKDTSKIIKEIYNMKAA